MSTVIRRPADDPVIRVAGRVFRTDRLTVDQVDTLESATPATVISALLNTAGVDPYTVRWSDVVFDTAEDDLPDTFEDGRPVGGGRPMDPYVVTFAKPPWCWPPDVTRRQTIRDLHLILTSLEGT